MNFTYELLGFFEFNKILFQMHLNIFVQFRRGEIVANFSNSGQSIVKYPFLKFFLIAFCLRGTIDDKGLVR